MQITVDYILERYKHRTFYLYHILGKKWGCTLNINKRLSEQGYKTDDCVEIKEVIGIKVADRLEKFLNEREGYPYNHTQSYIKNLLNRAIGLSKLDYSKRDNTNLGKGNKGKKLSTRMKKRISNTIHKKYALGEINIEAMIRRGEKNGNSKYTAEQARFVKKYYFKQKNQFTPIPKGKMTTNQLKDKLGVSKKFIRDVAYGRSWKHI